MAASSLPLDVAQGTTREHLNQPRTNLALQNVNGKRASKEGVLSTTRRDSESHNQTQHTDILWILVEKMNCKKIFWEYSWHGTKNLWLIFLMDNSIMKT